LRFEGNAEVHHCFGGYSDYVREKAVRLGRAVAAPVIARDTMAQEIKVKTTEASSPLTYGERIELTNIPANIDAVQKELEQIQATLDDAELFQRDPHSFTTLMARYEEMQQELHRLEERWLLLEERSLLSA
jgi:ABC transport system ATP-binding/permease protein